MGDDGAWPGGEGAAGGDELLGDKHQHCSSSRTKTPHLDDLMKTEKSVI